MLNTTVRTVFTKALPLILLFTFAVPGATAQQKKAPVRSKARPAPRPAAPAPPDFVALSSQVADQLRILARFVFVYGKIANGLEIAEQQAKRAETSPEISAKNQQARDTVVANISGLQAGIDKIALEFKANDRLQVQYLKLTGASDAIGNATQLAKAGRFDEAGKAIVNSIERLTDTILALKQPGL